MRDYHVHTVNSPDGHATIREQFTAAQAAGLEEICLTDQAYVKDPDISVQKYTENVAKELGGSIAISAFARFENRWFCPL